MDAAGVAKFLKSYVNLAAVEQELGVKGLEELLARHASNPAVREAAFSSYQC
jgi:hypothetical protein